MKVLRKIIQDRGISQNKLSHMAGIPASNICLILNDKQEPGPSWRKRLSETLQVSEDVLFSEWRPTNLDVLRSLSDEDLIRWLETWGQYPFDSDGTSWAEWARRTASF